MRRTRRAHARPGVERIGPGLLPQDRRNREEGIVSLNAKRVLVTGADGFIGSHLAEALVREGCEVRALVQYNSFGSHGWLDSADADVTSNMEIVLGDIRDPGSARTLTDGREQVFHLAALIAIPYSYDAPDAYVQTNVNGTLNLLNAARNSDIETFVHTSTSEVYGSARFVPMSEEHPLSAQSPYAATKIAADQLALSFQRSFGMPVSVIRPFNTYGPRQSARAVIPTVITQIAAGRRQIALGATSPTRDFCYVQDTVKGFMAVARSPAAVGEVTNIGSGFEISIGDTVELIAELMQREVEVVQVQARMRPEASEVERLFADTTRARERTGWTPGFGGLPGFRRGLDETIRWFQQPGNRATYRSDVYNK